jgi:hypothetical protein
MPPDLNPVKQTWRAVKRKIAATFIINYEHLTATIADTFKKLTEKTTHVEKWMARFLSPTNASKILCK